METKIINLIERNADEELKAYFANMSGEKPLDCHEELVLLTHFSPTAVKCYINRFRFSEKAEIMFIKKAPAELRLQYVNYYGLHQKTQNTIIKENLFDAARDFMQMRRFDDIDYLLDNGAYNMLNAYFRLYQLENDAQVKKLLYLKNTSIFYNYANKWYISESVKKEIIDNALLKPFTTIMYKQYRLFKRKSKTAMDFTHLIENDLAAEMLSEDLQIEVLTSCDRRFVEVLLKTCPLATKAQNVLFEYNYDAHWLKLHVEHLYGVGGYRFTPENEPKLFTKLASKNLDECLTEYRLKDDVSFVKFASKEAVGKYVKNFWLSDDAQVALILRNNPELVKAMISRFSPQHGMCWQAEVKLAESYMYEELGQYISFHTLCIEALSILERRGSRLIFTYHEKHPY